MKPSDTSRRWNHTDTPMSADFRHMSYALFRVDQDVGCIVDARSPDRGVFAIGSCILDRLDLSEEAIEHMNECYYEPVPMFIMTDKGIGLLLERYHLTAGLGLYLHIHTDPVSAARVINSGALMGREIEDYTISRRVKAFGSDLTRKDEAVYAILADVWNPIQRSIQHPFFRVKGSDELTFGELRDKMRKMAAFVGCELTFTIRKTERSVPASLQTRVKCYRPILLEALLLYLLSEIRERSATRSGVCRLEDPETRGRDGLALTLRYPIYPDEDPMTAQFTDTFHSHLSVVAELGGMDIYFPAEHPLSSTAEGLGEQFVILDQLLDPSLLSSTDLKAAIRFLCGETQRPPLFAEEIPFPYDENG